MRTENALACAERKSDLVPGAPEIAVEVGVRRVDRTACVQAWTAGWIAGGEWRREKPDRC